MVIFRELRNCPFPGPDHVDEYVLFSCVGWQAIAEVSCQWRAIALSDPFLWTSIPLGAPTETIHLYTTRSKGLPLRIFFCA